MPHTFSVFGWEQVHRAAPVMRRLLGVSVVAASVAFTACGSAPSSPQQAATQFVQALNAKNVPDMVTQAATPFHFRQQEWTTAGSDAVRGTAIERVAPTRYELGRLMQYVVANAKVATGAPEANAPEKADLLRDVLKDAPPEVWGQLNLFVFRRDANDPHLTIVGVDAGGKIQSLYVS
jgi:hypothetical protein